MRQTRCHARGPKCAVAANETTESISENGPVALQGGAFYNHAEGIARRRRHYDVTLEDRGLSIRRRKRTRFVWCGSPQRE